MTRISVLHFPRKSELPREKMLDMIIIVFPRLLSKNLQARDPVPDDPVHLIVGHF